MKISLKHTYVHELGHAITCYAILKEKYGKKKAIEVFKNLGIMIIVYSPEYRKHKELPLGKTRYLSKRGMTSHFTKEDREVIVYAGVCAETKLLMSEKVGNNYLTGYFLLPKPTSDLNKVSEKTRREKMIQIDYIKKKYILDDIILKASKKKFEPNKWINVYDHVKELL